MGFFGKLFGSFEMNREIATTRMNIDSYERNIKEKIEEYKIKEDKLIKYEEINQHVLKKEIPSFYKLLEEGYIYKPELKKEIDGLVERFNLRTEEILKLELELLELDENIKEYEDKSLRLGTRLDTLETRRRFNRIK